MVLPRHTVYHSFYFVQHHMVLCFGHSRTVVAVTGLFMLLYTVICQLCWGTEALWSGNQIFLKYFWDKCLCGFVFPTMKEENQRFLFKPVYIWTRPKTWPLFNLRQRGSSVKSVTSQVMKFHIILSFKCIIIPALEPYCSVTSLFLPLAVNWSL